MGKAVVRGGFDSYSSAASPSTEYPNPSVLRAKDGAGEIYVYFKSPVPRGATVTSATLTLHAAGTWGSSRTVTLRRISTSWTAGRVNWTNRPSTAGVAVDVTAGPLGYGAAVSFNVTGNVQSFADGTPNYGWKITVSGGDAAFCGLTARQYKPTLTVEWSDAPKKPTSLSPSAGAVGTTKPTLRFDYTDVSGSTRLAAVQVQIDSDKTGAPNFDSGEVATTVPELDLSETAYAGVTTPTFWRVRVKDAAGLWSVWSDWASLSYAAKGTVTITNPADITQPFVTEPTPPIAWTFSGAQAAWQVRILRASDRTVELYDSGKRLGTATAHTLPAGVLRDDNLYTVEVRAWDNVNREAVPGVPVYSLARRDFLMDDDLGTPGVTGITVTPEPDAPWVTLTWARTTMPDAFAVYRNGKVIANLIPEDVLVSGTTYTWRDYGARPHVSNSYHVKAVVNGKQSGATVKYATPKPVGIWLIDPARNLIVVLGGDDAGQWTMPDDAATYTPLGSTKTVRIVGGLRGYEGSLSGLLFDGMAGRSFAEQEEDLWDIKGTPSDHVRLIAGDVNIPALIGNLTVTPTPETRGGDIIKGVSFDFWQVGELAFEPRL